MDVLDATDLPDSGTVMGFGYVGPGLVPYIVATAVQFITGTPGRRLLGVRNRGNRFDPIFG